MLKRNGEPCQHEVPGYPGRLTTTEFQAYREAFAVVEDQVRAFTEAAGALADVEKQLPQISGPLTRATLEPGESLGAEVAHDPPWQTRRTLHKSARSQLHLCSRETGRGREFAVIECFDPTSPYAMANGPWEIHLVSNDPRLLLQDYLEQERRILQVFRTDLVSQVEEVLSQKYPDQDLSRVTKAIAARCNAAPAINESQSRACPAAEAVRVRM